MPAITLSDLSFAYVQNVPVLSAVELHLEPGWSGLIGPNGAGKTTLLKLLAGELEPDAGVLQLQPSHGTVLLCPQRVQSLDPSIEAFSGATDRLARRIAGELELEVSGLSRWESLSAGERKRWQIGAALHEQPDVLLLDEPTNHLDLPSVERLELALQGFPGALVVVTHDEQFARSCSSDEWALESGRVVVRDVL
jgi:ATPase subunit of ABC transporter with duplicated ATPase domains